MDIMYVSLREILENPVFGEAKVLCGAGGLDRAVSRVSVFDCTYEESVTDPNILSDGDLYITCLEQFNDSVRQTPQEFFRLLIEQKSAGLFVVGDHGLGNLTEDIAVLCDEKNFPVVHVPIEMPYALIMDTVNQYILFDNTNALNALKLGRIRYAREQTAEDLEILNSIKPGIGRFLAVCYVSGEFDSELLRLQLYKHFLKEPGDFFVLNQTQKIFLFSGETKEELQRHRRIMMERILENMPGAFVGQSRVMMRRDVREALEEAGKSLIIAEKLGIQNQVYDPLNTMQLLLILRDSRAAVDFYEAYVERIREGGISRENLRETLRTVEVYAAQQGNYRRAAEVLEQHENTVRYRVNKVRSALGMSEDPVKFNETVAIAMKIRALIGAGLDGEMPE